MPVGVVIQGSSGASHSNIGVRGGGPDSRLGLSLFVFFFINPPIGK